MTAVAAETSAAPAAIAPDVLGALLAGRDAPARPAAAGTTPWRLLLAAVGAIQVVLSWPGLLLYDGHASGHLAHELTSLDVGLAVGFLLLAWRPSRAWGALPLVTALVASVVGASVLDLASGHALLGRESVHLLELAGLGACWALARRLPRPSLVLRLA